MEISNTITQNIFKSAQHYCCIFYAFSEKNNIEIDIKTKKLIYLDSIIYSYICYEYFSPFSFYMVEEEIKDVLFNDEFMENVVELKFNNLQISKFIKANLYNYYDIYDNEKPNLILNIDDDNNNIIKKITKRYIGILGCRIFNITNIPAIDDKVITGFKFDNRLLLNLYYSLFSDILINHVKEVIYSNIYDNTLKPSDESLINKFINNTDLITFNDCLNLVELAIYDNKSSAFSIINTIRDYKNLYEVITTYQFEKNLNNKNNDPINKKEYCQVIANTIYGLKKFNNIYLELNNKIEYDYFLAKYINSIFYHLYSKLNKTYTIYDVMILSIKTALDIHDKTNQYSTDYISNLFFSFLKTSCINDNINGIEYTLKLDLHYHDEACFINYLTKMSLLFMYIYTKSLNNINILSEFMKKNDESLSDIAEYIDSIYFNEKQTFGKNHILWDEINNFAYLIEIYVSKNQFDIENKAKNISIFKYYDFSKIDVNNFNNDEFDDDEFNDEENEDDYPDDEKDTNDYFDESETIHKMDELKEKYLILSDKYIKDFIKYNDNYYDDINDMFSRTENYNNSIKLINLLDLLIETQNEKKYFLEIAEILLEMAKRNPYDEKTGRHYDFEMSAFKKGPGTCWLILSYTKNYHSNIKDIIHYYSLGMIKSNKNVDEFIIKEYKKKKINNILLIEYFPENYETLFSCISENINISYGFLLFKAFLDNNNEKCKQYAKQFKNNSTKEERLKLLETVSKHVYDRSNFCNYHQLIIRSNIKKYLLGLSWFLIIK